MLRAVPETLHWPLLLLAGLTLLAVRPFPARLVGYAERAEDLVRRFLEQKSRLNAGPRLQSSLSLRSLEDLHAAFKTLDWPESAAAYHWAVNEAMRHDIEALADLGVTSRFDGHRADAIRYWRRVEEEARRLTD